MKENYRRLVYFTPANLGPYHIARFSRLAVRYPKVVILGLPSSEKFRPWQSDKEPLRDHLMQLGDGKIGIDDRSKTHLVMEFLNHHEPETIVLAGYNDLSQRATAKWALQRGIPRILHADTWWGDRPRYKIKELFKKHFFIRAMADAAFVPGIRSSMYLQTLGIPEKAIWQGLDVIDNDFFSMLASETHRDREHWQNILGVPEDYFLTVSRLSPEKNMVGLIQAFRQYRHKGGTWKLVIVGDGTEREAMHSAAGEMAEGDILIVGWKQYEELPLYYGLARCFVLPSISEPWGLVVNEAMACGLPVLVSRQCGCLPELCHRGINGFDFDPHDMEDLAQLMLRVSNNSIGLEVMGMASSRIIANYTLDTWVQALSDCIETTTERVRAGKYT